MTSTSPGSPTEPSLRVFEFKETYLIEVHLEGIEEKDVNLTFDKNGKALYLSIKYLRKMVYAAEVRMKLNAHKYVPWIFKRRVDFVNSPVNIDEGQVVSKVAADGIFVVVAPKVQTGFVSDASTMSHHQKVAAAGGG